MKPGLNRQKSISSQAASISAWCTVFDWLSIVEALIVARHGPASNSAARRKTAAVRDDRLERLVGVDVPAADHERDPDALAVHLLQTPLELDALGGAGRVRLDRLVDSRGEPEVAGSGHAGGDCRFEPMRVTRHAYDVAGWGRGELWLDGGRGGQHGL